jgi:hypothetical protein
MGDSKEAEKMAAHEKLKTGRSLVAKNYKKGASEVRDI